MSGRIEVGTKPAEIPAEALRQGPVALTPQRVRDPALGILVAVICSALIWPALLVLWLYVLR